MAKREYVQLAHTYDSKKHSISGWYASKKLDGMRAFWDGGVSSGSDKAKVPWANTNKDDRYIQSPIATGLWSRLGNIIHAPDYWLNELPTVPLDGELYSETMTRQELFSTIKKLTPDPIAWREVKFYAFDIPPLDTFFEDGVVSNIDLRINREACLDFIKDFDFDWMPDNITPYWKIVKMLPKVVHTDIVVPHRQIELPHVDPESTLDRLTNEIVERGGEGMIVRHPSAFYTTIRSHQILKVKPYADDEGVIIGFNAGEGKYRGMIGSVNLRLRNTLTISLSGFTDEERKLPQDAAKWSYDHPGEDCPDWINGLYFKKGDVITFKYRGLSDDGRPMEARYLRLPD